MQRQHFLTITMQTNLIFLLTICLTVFKNTVQSQVWSYNDSVFLQIRLSTKTQERCLQKLEKRLKLGVVSLTLASLAEGEYLVPRIKFKYFIANLNQCAIRYKVLAENLKQILEEEAEENDFQDKVRASKRKRRWTRSNSNTEVTPYTYFMNSSETNKWLKTMATKHKKLVQLHGIGNTFEGREMMVMQVGPDNNDNYVFLESGIHAREWLSPASNAYLLNKVLLKSANDSTMQSILNHFTLFFLINSNPDGYDYTFMKNATYSDCRYRLPARLWRKTRRPYHGHFGADPNRNFGASFYDKDSDREPCESSYSGPYPFSENCVRNIANFMSRLKHEKGIPWIFTLSIHSYGKFWLLPGSTKKMTVHDNNEREEQMFVANSAIKAIIREGGNTVNYYDTDTWKIGTVQELLHYTAAGASHDWYRTRMKVRFAYGIELSRGCRSGFMACNFQIAEQGEQLYSALVSALVEIKKLGY